MKLQRDLREFIELLNSLKVDYLIVGGHAAVLSCQGALSLAPGSNQHMDIDDARSKVLERLKAR